MLIQQKIKVGTKSALAVCLPLGAKKLIVIRAKKGYIMCGYLNMQAARKFKEVAAKISGIASIEQALGAKLVAVSPQAAKHGLYKGQSVKDALSLLT